MTAAVNASWDMLDRQQTRIQTQVGHSDPDLKTRALPTSPGCPAEAGKHNGGKNCFEVFQSKSTGLGEWGEGVEPRGPAFVLPLTCWVS